MESVITAESIAAPSGLDLKRYGKLLVKFAPKVIETEAAVGIVEKLMQKGDDSRNAEEDAVLELLSSLIEQFERKAYPILAADPRDVLRDLMEHNEVKAIDLAGILGSRAKVSEILSGKRAISKEQAKRLGARFGVSPAVFI
jgi:HTH-type transcriptional regulator/antitoxin HigA